MGNVFSLEKEPYELEDWMCEPIGYSRQHKTSSWDYPEKPKNFEYWFGKDRFTYISREYYPDYSKGYLYGRYKDESYYSFVILDEEDEELLELAL